jgi:hypothetical protein
MDVSDHIGLIKNMAMMWKGVSISCSNGWVGTYQDFQRVLVLMVAKFVVQESTIFVVFSSLSMQLT